MFPESAMPRFDQLVIHLLKVADRNDGWLAWIAGCDRSTVARWREGHRAPSIEHLRRMAASPEIDTWFREACQREMQRRCSFQKPTHNPRELDIDNDGDVDEDDIRSIDAKKQSVAAARRIVLEQELRDGLGNGVGPDLVRLASEEADLSRREVAAVELVAETKRWRR